MNESAPVTETNSGRDSEERDREQEHVVGLFIFNYLNILQRYLTSTSDSKS